MINKKIIFLSSIFLFHSLFGRESTFISTMEQGTKNNFFTSWKNYYNPQVELNLKPGLRRSLSSIDFMVPLYSQPQKESLFLDMRFVRDNKSSQEYNLGIGYRHLMPNTYLVKEPLILGVYGFYDYRLSPKRNVFRQATFGIEALNTWFEGRINGYYPTRRQYSIGSVATGNASGAFVGHFYFLSRNTQLQTEAAMPGFDAEAGARIPIPFIDDQYQWRVFLGGYQFKRKGFKNVSGPRVRTTFLINNPFEKWGLPNAKIKLGAEIAKDTVRGTQSFLEFGLRIPLGSFGKKNLENETDRLFQQPIQRDVDVVSQQRTTDVESRLQVNETPFTFYHVNQNASAGGDGTAESPFTSLQDAADALITAGSQKSFIYVSSDLGGPNARLDIRDTGDIADGIFIISPTFSWTDSKLNLASTTGLPTPSHTRPTINSGAFAFLSYDVGQTAFIHVEGLDATSNINTINIQNTPTEVYILHSTITTTGITATAVNLDASGASTLNNNTIASQNIGFHALNTTNVNMGNTTINATNVGVRASSGSNINLSNVNITAAVLTHQNGGIITEEGT